MAGTGIGLYLKTTDDFGKRVGSDESVEVAIGFVLCFRVGEKANAYVCRKTMSVNPTNENADGNDSKNGDFEYERRSRHMTGDCSDGMDGRRRLFYSGGHDDHDGAFSVPCPLILASPVQQT